MPGSLESGGQSTCTLTLTKAAGSSGATVTLGSNNGLLTVPGTATVSSGQTTGTFIATAGTISAAVGEASVQIAPTTALTARLPNDWVAATSPNAEPRRNVNARRQRPR